MNKLSNEKLQELCEKVFNLNCYNFATQTYNDFNPETGKPVTAEERLFFDSISLVARTDIGAEVLSRLSPEQPIKLIIDEHYNDGKPANEQAKGYCSQNHLVAIADPSYPPKTCANILIHELTHEMQFQTNTDKNNIPCAQDRFLIEHMMEAEARLNDKIFDVQLARLQGRPVPQYYEEQQRYAVLKANQEDSKISDGDIKMEILQIIYHNQYWLDYYLKHGLNSAQSNYSRRRTKHHGKSPEKTICQYLQRMDIPLENAKFFLNPDNVPNYPREEIPLKSVATRKGPKKETAINEISQNGTIICNEICDNNGNIIESFWYDSSQTLREKLALNDKGNITMRMEKRYDDYTVTTQYDELERPMVSTISAPDGQISEKKLFSYVGTAQTIETYEKDGRKTQEKTIDSKNGMETITDYNNDGSKDIRIVNTKNKTTICQKYNTAEIKATETIVDHACSPARKVITHFTSNNMINKTETYSGECLLAKALYNDGQKIEETTFIDGVSLGTITKYDKNGQIVENTEYAENGHIQYRERYNPVAGSSVCETYNENGILLKRKTKQKDSAAIEYFTSNGAKLSEIKTIYKNDVPVHRQTFNYETQTTTRTDFAPSGKKAKSEIYSGTVLIGHIQYDGNGRKTLREMFDWSGNITEQTFYDKHGNKTEEIINNILEHRRTTYTGLNNIATEEKYDIWGNIESETLYKHGKISRRTVHNCEDNGVPITQVSTYDNGELSTIAIEDKNGNPLASAAYNKGKRAESTTYAYTGDKLTSAEKCVYDDKGGLKSRATHTQTENGVQTQTTTFINGREIVGKPVMSSGKNIKDILASNNASSSATPQNFTCLQQTR